MKNKLESKALYCFLLLLSTCFAARSQETKQIDITTTAVPFLRISPDARAAGMADLGLSTAPDANSQFYNVAKYAFAENQNGIGLNYVPWLRNLGLNDVFLGSVSSFYKIDDNSAFSASLRYFSLGDLQLTDGNGNDLSSARPREMAIDAGYSRKLGEDLSIGMSLRYIHSNLMGNTAQNGVSYQAGRAVAGDLGIYYSTADAQGRRWKLASVFSNLGSKLSYTADGSHRSLLPANWGIGGGYSWTSNEDHSIEINGEFNKLLVPGLPTSATEEEFRKYKEQPVVDSWIKSLSNDAFSTALGVEYAYKKQLFLRSGYHVESKTLGSQNYATSGIGVRYDKLEVNFSYLIITGSNRSSNALTNTFRIGAAMQLN